jgi:hypothetical protein
MDLRRAVPLLGSISVFSDAEYDLVSGGGELERAAGDCLRLRHGHGRNAWRNRYSRSSTAEEKESDPKTDTEDEESQG